MESMCLESSEFAFEFLFEFHFYFLNLCDLKQVFDLS